MGVNISGLTVYFEEPFWVGIFARIESGKLSACKVIFGAEPKDHEVWEFVLKKYPWLKFSPSVDVVVKKDPQNPKRRQREIRKQASSRGMGTKSQQALQMQRERSKLERRSARREQQRAEAQRQFALKQQKRKEKHRGK